MIESVLRVLELETLFSANKYYGSGEKAFIIENGIIPIMISAPHAVNQFRDGVIKFADLYTGGIARYLHERTGCHIIYSSKFAYNDPNYDPLEYNQYQVALADYLSENKIYVLIDLHGASRNREYAAEMGTAPISNPLPDTLYEDDPSLHEYKFIDDIIESTLKKHFNSLDVEKKDIWKNVIFDAGSQNTVTKYISENTETACVQLEVNRIYRDPKDERSFECLINGLIEIIDILYAIFSRL